MDPTRLLGLGEIWSMEALALLVSFLRGATSSCTGLRV